MDINQENQNFLEVILKVIYTKLPSNNKLATAYVIAMPYIIIDS